MGQLDTKVCVVTGAAGSIGFASARSMLVEGASVLLVDMDESALAARMAEAAEFGERVAACTADVADTASTQAYIATAQERWGKIDVIFSNAGASGEIAPITEYPEEVFDRVMAINVRASFLACKYGLPEMNDGGSIIITSSIMGVQANPNIVAYATSKHAVIGLMRTVAKEAAPRNIRVNVIAPGPVDNEFQTDIEDRLGKRVGIDATQMINQAIPLKRHASADEIAGTVLFLASDQSSFSTGSVFMADGGLNA
jgi:NAD(P)-dependent dehydrogenase (short-subunit alcohol dehydrogenase family)